MKLISKLACAALMTSCMASPAFAAYDRLGQVSVSQGRDRDVFKPDFGGPIERLQFTAQRKDIRCSDVTVTFGNGRTVSVYSGTLMQNQPRSVDLPGTSRDVRRINFTCRAYGGEGVIQVGADIGRYRDTWMKNPNWSRTWANAFHWGSDVSKTVDNDVNYWVPVGTASFTGRDDHSVTQAGWAGRSVNSIGLKPDTDAICSGVSIHYGRNNRLALGSARLVAGQTKRFDLNRTNSGDRNVSDITLNCRPLDGRRVNISIYANK